MNVNFDKIFFITLADDKDRVENVKKQIDKLGIQDKSEIKYNCIDPYNYICGKLLMDDVYYLSRPNSLGAVFGSTYTHYNIIKTSYLLGLNNILICEDDVNFCDDLNLIEETFNNLPKDYCCVKFHTSGHVWGSIKYENDLPNQEYFKDNFDYKCMSVLCYALDRNGMEKFINAYENKFRAADVLLIDFMNDIYCIKKQIIIDPNMESNIV